MLVPGGQAGVWLCGGLGFAVVLFCLVISLVPPGDTANKWIFFIKVLAETVVTVLIGLALYWRGAREQRKET